MHRFNSVSTLHTSSGEQSTGTNCAVDRHYHISGLPVEEIHLHKLCSHSNHIQSTQEHISPNTSRTCSLQSQCTLPCTPSKHHIRTSWTAIDKQHQEFVVRYKTPLHNTLLAGQRIPLNIASSSIREGKMIKPVPVRNRKHPTCIRHHHTHHNVRIPHLAGNTLGCKLYSFHRSSHCNYLGMLDNCFELAFGWVSANLASTPVRGQTLEIELRSKRSKSPWVAAMNTKITKDREALVGAMKRNRATRRDLCPPCRFSAISGIFISYFVHV